VLSGIDFRKARNDLRVVAKAHRRRYSWLVSAATLGTWAKLADTIARESTIEVPLEPLRRMINAANQDAIAASQRLSGLFMQTEALYPGVGDPLGTKVDLGSNRWLGRDSENSYSDWLAWILERQDDPSQVLPLFGLANTQNVPGKWTIEREVATAFGRLDLLISNPQLGVLCIEVKTESEPGPGQLERYLNWLAGKQSLDLVLLAIDQPDDPPGEKYRFRSWKNVALGLRTWSSIWLRELRLYDAVMTLAFCGAIERNLLSLHSGGMNALRTAEYLEEVLNYAKTTSQ
jgi:hypothetical protein